MPRLDERETFEEQGSPRQSRTSGPGLKARAVRYLSVREHSRQELARKLAAYAMEPDEVQAVLDELQQEGWQSDERFAQSFEHHQSVRFGARRIASTMRERGLDDDLIRQSIDRLQSSESQRAWQVWQKRFGSNGLPSDPKEHSRQARFLLSRGFDAGIVNKILAGRHDPSEPDSTS